MGRLATPGLPRGGVIVYPGSGGRLQLVHVLLHLLLLMLERWLSFRQPGRLLRDFEETWLGITRPE